MKKRPVQVCFPRSLIAPDLISTQYSLAPASARAEARRVRPSEAITNARPLQHCERFRDSTGRSGIVVLGRADHSHTAANIIPPADDANRGRLKLRPSFRVL